MRARMLLWAVSTSLALLVVRVIAVPLARPYAIILAVVLIRAAIDLALMPARRWWHAPSADGRISPAMRWRVERAARRRPA